MGVVPPTAPLKVVFPVPVRTRLKAPSTVPRVAAPVVVAMVRFPPSVVAPARVTLLAVVVRVDAAFTVRPV